LTVNGYNIGAAVLEEILLTIVVEEHEEATSGKEGAPMLKLLFPMANV
jgi:hypothetical protein